MSAQPLLRFSQDLRERMIAHNEETPEERTASVLSAVACNMATIANDTARMASALERIADTLPTVLALTDAIRRIQALESHDQQHHAALGLHGCRLAKVGGGAC